jgi:FG-GAP-like repeat
LRRRVAALAAAAGVCWAQSRFVEHRACALPSGAANGAAIDGRTLYVWGDRIRIVDLSTGRQRVGPAARSPFGEGGCITDVDGDGKPDLVLNRGDVLLWSRAPKWELHRAASPVDAADMIPATVLGRRGVLVVHRRSQVRFYEIPADPSAGWPATEIYSFYTPSNQGGMLLADIDHDGITDLLCGNYWIKSPNRFDLPWRLFAIEPWSEEPDSAMLRLALEDLTGSGKPGLIAAQRRMPPDGSRGRTQSAGPGARLAWFEQPGDPRQLWIEHRLDSELSGVNSLATADFDLDRRPDIFTAESSGTGRLIVYHNDGAGRFSPQVIAQGKPVKRAFVADLNQDGRPDIVAVLERSVVWWENKP